MDFLIVNYKRKIRKYFFLERYKPQFPKFLLVNVRSADLLRRHDETLARDFVGIYRQGRGMPRRISKITPNMRLTLQSRSPPIVTSQHRALDWPLFSGFSTKNSWAKPLWSYLDVYWVPAGQFEVLCLALRECCVEPALEANRREI